MKSIQTFYHNDRLHRLDGPAIIWQDGEEHWFVNGERHRDHGPAIVRKDGTVEYWVEGRQLDSFWHHIHRYHLHLADVWRAYQQKYISFGTYRVLVEAPLKTNKDIDYQQWSLQLYINGGKKRMEEEHAYKSIRMFKLSTRPRFRIKKL